MWRLVLFLSLVSGEELLLGLMGMRMRYGPPFMLQHMGSAMTMAVDRINSNDTILPNHTIRYVVGLDQCSPKMALDTIVTLVRDQAIIGVIGPSCSGSAKSAGLLASQWNVPMISYTTSAMELSDKSVYDTFSRTYGPSYEAGQAIRAVVAQYGWTKIGALHSVSGGHYNYMLDGAKHYLGQDNVTLVGPELYTAFVESPTATFQDALKALALKSRIILMMGYHGCSETIRCPVPGFLLAAYDLGMFEDNDFLFIMILVDMDERTLNFEWAFSGDEIIDAKLREGYRHCLIITKIPYFLNAEYKMFLEEVRSRLIEPPFFTNLTDVSKVSEYAGYLYDATMLYGLTSDAMLKDGLDPTDGRAFTQYAPNIVFKGQTGSVSVNENGDRNDDFQIMHYEDGQFKQIGYFDSFTKQYIAIDNVSWPSGLPLPPPDTPVCGFQNELCLIHKQDQQSRIAGGAVCAAIVAVSLAVGAILYRKKQFEAQLLAANWKIDQADLVYAKDGRWNSINSITDAMSQASGLHVASAIYNIALYKSERVYVKKYEESCSVDWKRRTILLELKYVRDIQHENLVMFLGACPDSPVCMVTRLCSKGSLDDVLQNDDINLDLTFKISFALDIVNGLKYLSKSDIRYHGRLSSSNCLIDNRWTIKLTDYGLWEFRSEALKKMTTSDDFAHYKKQLWMAPEQLRYGELSHKADVYSLGIVLLEIMTRSPPYYNITLTPKEIVERVEAVITGKPFRPEINTEQLPGASSELIEKCLSESPEDRPDLGVISRSLKIINGGKQIDIMDNMVSMLEKYADNLEEIVTDRTKQLTDEKKKTDILLYQMLPPQVAESLKQGKTVQAETFDQVSIFFSDIVGFTDLSASSTPMEVVQLLNDLYTTFDSIIENYDVYKVETIGDAYMVVSGLPVRNGIQHAGHIATMSLDLISEVGKFRIRHRPDHKLLLRIGIHSGGVVAGVVGLKMPRYCLFGDTVNMASRMESHSLALRIHVSIATADILEELTGYVIIERGKIEIKGKGTQDTYWLMGKNGYERPLPWNDVIKE